MATAGVDDAPQPPRQVLRAEPRNWLGPTQAWTFPPKENNDGPMAISDEGPAVIEPEHGHSGPMAITSSSLPVTSSGSGQDNHYTEDVKGASSVAAEAARVQGTASGNDGPMAASREILSAPMSRINVSTHLHNNATMYISFKIVLIVSYVQITERRARRLRSGAPGTAPPELLSMFIKGGKQNHK